MTKIDGPRLAPKSGKADALVVFLHGYGADGRDLIDLGQQWQNWLPNAAFVSPHAPEPCGMSPMGRQWFPLTMRDPSERWRGVVGARPSLDAFLDDAPAAPGEWQAAEQTVDAIRERFGSAAIGPASAVSRKGLRLVRKGAQQWGPDHDQNQG